MQTNGNTYHYLKEGIKEASRKYEIFVLSLHSALRMFEQIFGGRQDWLNICRLNKVDVKFSRMNKLL